MPSRPLDPCSRFERRAVEDILIVDDHGPVREALRACLELALPQFHIREAEDGRSAWVELRRLPPSLVLMDVNLPDVNGIQLTAEIKKSLPDVPVVVITRHSIEPYVDDALAAGASAFVVKEAAQRDLLPVLMRVLGRTDAAPSPVDEAAAPAGADCADAGSTGTHK
jgi:DNA-binding NarL/FixJ family response regulator